jgi:hypothetical protein
MFDPGPEPQQSTSSQVFGSPPQRAGLPNRALRSPILQLAVYYLVLLVVGTLLIRSFPLVQRALITPAVPVLAEGAALLTGGARTGLEATQAAQGPQPPVSERAITTLLIALSAIALAIPVAWVYMLTKRLRFDPGLVRSIVILPIAVAGILLVVKHSLAIAFSLAGIVAAVRFRNTLKDPRDAVYIFLTIAIGIAAGVQALDVALVVSFVFNVTVFALWKFQVGSLQGGRYGRTGVISIGDSSLLVAQSPEVCEALRRDSIEAAEGLKPDGIMLVHTSDPEVSRHAVAEALRQNADDWHALPPVGRGAGITTARYLVELAKKSDPADLLGALDEWPAQVAAAEFVPFHSRRRPRSEPDPDDDDDE